MANLKKNYEKLIGFREGAHFCKMDLHTHSPASECSSFKLPAVFEDRIKSLKEGLKNSAGQDEARAFLEQLQAGEDVFGDDYAAADLKNLPWVAPRPALGTSNLKRIAAAWLGDLERLEEGDAKGLKKVLGDALRDVRAYLQSLFWPEEYVMRCYLESLEVVALTDHNHPGYIVPRLPQLGTWFGALQRVNERWRKDLLKKSRPGSHVGPRMLARLQLAEQLVKAGVTLTADDHTTRQQHSDKRKKLKKKKERLVHIRELISKWEWETAVPRPLTLLPGIEITVSDVHMLSVFPPTWYVPGRIAGILSDIGILESQWGRGFEAAASASVQTTIDRVHEAGGIAIPAHANSDFKGILRLFKKGLALTKVLEHPALVALETTGGTVLAGEGRKKGKNACETLRSLDAKQAKALCFTKGSDSHECRSECDGTGEDLGARFTWVKMDLRENDTPDEVFRALRLALRSGNNRIVEYPTEDGYNYRGGKSHYRVPKKHRSQMVNWEGARPVILGLAVSGKGSYADGVTARFGPFLNSVIGSGGKSTLVRLLGYAFGAMGFMQGTRPEWLPKVVRAFWLHGDHTFCIERRKCGLEPDGEGVEVRWLERLEDGGWEVLHENGSAALQALRNQVILWPSREVQDKKKELAHFESKVIGQLLKRLEEAEGDEKKPLLINQPREIFNGQRLFDDFLSRPLLRDRQIIWSTGSPNVPAALDAEKILVTGETKNGSRMKVICAGDLHEDEIRDQLLDHFEGGAGAFYRRQMLYDL
jgi:hypothetical protein